jgi:L-iditol 2-dehydrogenase
MKALVLKEYNHLVYEDVPEPQIAPDEVLVQVKACGICGSDVHGVDGSTGRRIPPIIMGHEAAGVIADVGSEVSAWRKGDRVTFDIAIYCGGCYFCRRGLVNLCDNRRILGVSTPEFRMHGAYAEYVAVPQQVLYRLPEALSFERAAMMEPVSVAAHAIERTPISLHDTAVVVGSGMIGLLIVQFLKMAGCGQIIAVDLEQDRLDMACSLGADVGLKSGVDAEYPKGDVPGEVRRRTGNRGADIAFEVVGFTPTVQMAVASLRKGGSLTLVGNLSPTVELPLQAVQMGELSLNGSANSAGESEACLEMMASGAVNVDTLISAVAPLAEGVSWFERLHKREAGLMKVILLPGA